MRDILLYLYIFFDIVLQNMLLDSHYDFLNMFQKKLIIFFTCNIISNKYRISKKNVVVKNLMIAKDIQKTI